MTSCQYGKSYGHVEKEDKIFGGQIEVVYNNGFPGGSVVKNPPAVQEIQQELRAPSLGQEDPLEKEMATCSSLLAWETPWTEEPWWATVYRVEKKSDTTE